MAPTRRTLLLAIGTTGALAGCLSDDDAADDDGPTDDGDDIGDDDGMANGDNDGDADEPEAPTVDVSTHPDYGEILVDGEGMTLYMFDSDEQGAGESTCYDQCAENWPPLVVEDDPLAGDDVEADLATFERDDGELQASAAGWPLYYWVGDEEPGDTNGQGVNDVWWVLEADGTPIRDEEEPEEEDDDPDDDAEDENDEPENGDDEAEPDDDEEEDDGDDYGY